MQKNNTISSLVEALVDKYGSRALPIDLSDYIVHCIYAEAIPFDFKNDGEPKRNLYTFMGTKIATGYQRIVYSDYGPYLEISKDEIVKDALQQNSGTTKELEGNVATYLSFTSVDGLAHIRFQAREGLRHAVSSGGFARSFTATKYYVSAFEVCPGTLIPVEEGDLLPNEAHGLVCQAVNCHGKYRDGISRDVSKLWPEVEKEYMQLCEQYDPLSLLGTYQVVLLDEEGREGVVNLFCDMSSGRNRRQAGMNHNALVRALYDACNDAPDLQFIIPYGIGCKEKEYLWPELHLKLSCRLLGKKVKIIRTPSTALIPDATQEPAGNNTAVRAASVVDSFGAGEYDKLINEALCLVLDWFENAGTNSAPTILGVLETLSEFSDEELNALSLILNRNCSEKKRSEEDELPA